MEITSSTVYWITRLDYFSNATFCVGTAGMLLGGIFLVMSIIALLDGDKVKWLCWLLACVFITGLLSTTAHLFIPTTKEMCAIKVLPVIANNDEVQQLPNKVVELANEWIDELKPNKENK